MKWVGKRLIYMYIELCLQHAGQSTVNFHAKSYNCTPTRETASLLQEGITNSLQFSPSNSSFGASGFSHRYSVQRVNGARVGLKVPSWEAVAVIQLHCKWRATNYDIRGIFRDSTLR